MAIFIVIMLAVYAAGKMSPNNEARVEGTIDRLTKLIAGEGKDNTAS